MPNKSVLRHKHSIIFAQITGMRLFKIARRLILSNNRIRISLHTRIAKIKGLQVRIRQILNTLMLRLKTYNSIADTSRIGRMLNLKTRSAIMMLIFRASMQELKISTNGIRLLRRKSSGVRLLETLAACVSLQSIPALMLNLQNDSMQTLWQREDMTKQIHS